MFFRKQRRNDVELSDTVSSRPSSAYSRSLFTLSKSHSKTSPESEPERSRGNLGLSLLHCPDNPAFDFIFVHGLGGDSKKTWSTSGVNFWPQEWLPKDTAFKSVRIHTYGYSSDYLKGKGDCLSIHHFGKGLLAAISTSPLLANSDTHIVAIGHSLGGLVIKKAYMLAKHDAIHTSLADRFSAIFFLATPHRGADSAKLLKNILRLAYDRSYVGDLNPNSAAIQIINDEFRHVSTTLTLWSFYETQNMKMFGSLIVDPESALLGYSKENQVPMAADHRSICKFGSTLDPNYMLLRNALASTVSVTALESDVETKDREMKKLRKYVEAADVLDDEFSRLCELRQHSSCEWILRKKNFVVWKDDSLAEPNLLWIKGKPASGKSVLASFIIEHLRQSGKTCSFFFFKYGDKSKSTLHCCLRHWAYQMADEDRSCREELLKKSADGIQLTRMDERTIWRTIFQSGVLKHIKSPHYFVIDALDECTNTSGFFDTILASLDPRTPLRILFLSRETPLINQGLASVASKFLSTLSIFEEDTLPDIRRIVQGKIQALPAVQANSQDAFVERILNKSKGSFLWTILVLQELANCHTLKDAEKVLEDVPKGMEALYRRTLSLMESAPRSKTLAKAVLLWTACAIRPMTVSELNGALKLDMNDTIPQLRESIVALCGQLVAVDKTGRVQMIHETAREFLLSEDLVSEFSVNAKEAHTHMAKICLQYLISDEMRPPRVMRRRNFTSLDSRDDFALYTYYAYSYHLSKADPSSAGLLDLVESFLKSNVLTWIEAIAIRKDLQQLIRSSNHLRKYANTCAEEDSPMNKRVHDLQQWPRDMARATAMFAPALAAAPPAIYSIIPPLCPQISRLHKTTGVSRRLKVLGSVHEQWDDRLLGIDFRRGQPTSMCYGEDFLAVGLTTGAVSLYHMASYQEYRVIEHGESVKYIAFKKKTALIATCGLKSVKLWSLRSGEEIYSFKSPPQPLDLQFQDNFLMVASQKNFIVSWDITEEGDPQRIERSWVHDENGKPAFGTARALALSEAHNMLAVAYNGRPITVWDTEEASIIGTCGKKLMTGDTSSHPVTSMVFNPNPNIGLLAAIYLDGNLAILDPVEDKQIQCFRANCQSLAASPNGRLLAAGGANGIIHVFEFDTLKILYKVKSQNSFIKSLCFARDSFMFADIRGTRCTVWEPEVLLRASLGDDSGGAANNSTVEITSVISTATITAISAPEKANVIFCGKDDGTVGSYSSSTAEFLSTCYKHNVAIRHLESWDAPQGIFVLSIDLANRILMYKILGCDMGETTAAEHVLEVRLGAAGAITDLLVNKQAKKLLLSTAESDFLVDMASEGEPHERKLDSRPSMQADRKWIQHPTSAAHVLCISSDTVEYVAWDNFSVVGEYALEVSYTKQFVYPRKVMEYTAGGTQTIFLEMFDVSREAICIGTLEDLDTRTSSSGERSQDGLASGTPAFVSTSGHARNESVGGAQEGNEAPRFCEIDTECSDILHTIGVNSLGSLVFLNRDSWVCSIDLKVHRRAGAMQPATTSAIEMKKHFFLPHTWFAGRKGIVSALARHDILLARGNELAVIRGYAEHQF